MKKIYNIHNININDRLYYKEQKEDSTIYHIFKLTDVTIQKENIVLSTVNCFSFMVPNNSNLKAYLYENYPNVTMKKTDSLYKLSESEYLNTYLTFMKNDKKCVYELPSKLIQDE